MFLLRILDLSAHELEIYPAVINKLTGLEELYLGGSRKIGSIPDQIGQLTNLRVLNLSANNLRDLPPTIANLVNLTELNLSHNEFDDFNNLPEEMVDLTNLESINLSYNNFTQLPKVLLKLPKLRHLKINNNALTEKAQTQLQNLLPACSIEFLSVY
ncbi:leucine-rich repeat domain-containing protein [Xanthocytophaga flavus]|uniref:leucine-rich repeat domain-containing protein n=1 Tax=Xanthocytophaga flava TaxID=3048013 RepID=UPI0028D230B5|nr:leucine-rich repeat domain-containing protein [Xanthocytophaga flavus]